MNTKNAKPNAGEIWLADLGMVAKTRPVLVLAYPEEKDARMLVIVAPLTSQIRNLDGEVALPKFKWLPKPSAVCRECSRVGEYRQKFSCCKIGNTPSKRLRFS